MPSPADSQEELCMDMTGAQVTHLPWAGGHGRSTWAMAVGRRKEKCTNPVFFVAFLCTRENKGFGKLCSDLVGRLYKCLKK